MPNWAISKIPKSVDRFAVRIEERAARFVAQMKVGFDAPRDHATAERGAIQNIQATETTRESIDGWQARATRNRDRIAAKYQQIRFQQTALQSAPKIKRRIIQSLSIRSRAFLQLSSVTRPETLDEMLAALNEVCKKFLVKSTGPIWWIALLGVIRIGMPDRFRANPRAASF